MYIQTISYPINVQVLGGCATTIITPQPIPLLIYQVNTPKYDYFFTSWSESYGTCTPFTYSYIDLNTLSTLPFLTVTSSTRDLSFLSISDADAGLYTLRLDGALQYLSASTQFQIEIRPTCYITSLTTSTPPLPTVVYDVA